MSKSKFTDGPWLYQGADIGVPLLRIACGDGDHPAHEGRSYEAKEANAKLMSAAPELLERLTELMEYSDALIGSDVYRRCQEAIAKATA